MLNSTDVLHIGLGNFHRAHQCVYFERAGLTVASCSLRTRAVVDALVPNGGCFTLLTLNDGAASAREVKCLREPVFYPDDPEAWLNRFASLSVRLVTITVTEKGYPRNAGGDLDVDDPGICADLSAAAPPTTMIGVLTEGLRRRRNCGLAGLTVVSCDNLPGNGSLLRRLVLGFARAQEPALAEWIEAACKFPSTMVDCIVPAIRDADRAQARTLIGYDDAGLVVAEPFRMWIMEKGWVGDRPKFDGPDFYWVEDAAAFDAMKLRLLNAVHTALACLGQAAGHEFIWQAAMDPVLAEFARGLQVELLPTVPPTPGFDQETYIATILPRFSNRDLPHRTSQVATDSSQKVPIRLLGPADVRSAMGLESPFIATAVAGWLRHVQGVTDDGHSYSIADPRIDELASSWHAVAGDPKHIWAEVSDLKDLVPARLRQDRRFSTSVGQALEVLCRSGVRNGVSGISRVLGVDIDRGGTRPVPNLRGLK